MESNNNVEKHEPASVDVIPAADQGNVLNTDDETAPTSHNHVAACKEKLEDSTPVAADASNGPLDQGDLSVNRQSLSKSPSPDANAPRAIKKTNRNSTSPTNIADDHPAAASPTPNPNALLSSTSIVAGSNNSNSTTTTTNPTSYPGASTEEDANFSTNVNSLAAQLTNELALTGHDEARSSHFQWNAEAKEFVPCFGLGGNSGNAYAGMNGQEESGEYDFLGQMSVLLEQVVTDPAGFDSHAAGLLLIVSSLHGEPAIKCAVELIFETGLSQQYYGYVCAKLCAYLVQSLPPESGTILRNCLLERCQQEHTGRELLKRDAPSRLQHFVLFMAEIYLHLTLGDGFRIKRLAFAQAELLETLLAQPSAPEDVKTACMALKCCGLYLDIDLATDAAVATAPMSQSDRLTALLEMAKTAATEQTRGIVDSVITLRGQNWNDPMACYAAAAHDSRYGSSEELEVGPDGLPLSKEELQFIEDMLNEQEGTGDQSQRYSSASDDDEMYEAYETFLEMQRKQNK